MNDNLWEEIKNLRSTLHSVKECLETILANAEEGLEPDWFDKIYVRQELEKIKKVI